MVFINLAVSYLASSPSSAGYKIPHGSISPHPLLAEEGEEKKKKERNSFWKMFPLSLLEVCLWMTACVIRVGCNRAQLSKRHLRLYKMWWLIVHRSRFSFYTTIQTFENKSPSTQSCNRSHCIWNASLTNVPCALFSLFIRLSIFPWKKYSCDHDNHNNFVKYLFPFCFWKRNSSSDATLRFMVNVKSRQAYFSIILLSFLTVD